MVVNLYAGLYSLVPLKPDGGEVVFCWAKGSVRSSCKPDGVPFGVPLTVDIKYPERMFLRIPKEML